MFWLIFIYRDQNPQSFIIPIIQNQSQDSAMDNGNEN